MRFIHLAFNHLRDYFPFQKAIKPCERYALRRTAGLGNIRKTDTDVYNHNDMF